MTSREQELLTDAARFPHSNIRTIRSRHHSETAQIPPAHAQRDNDLETEDNGRVRRAAEEAAVESFSRPLEDAGRHLADDE